MSKYVSIEQLWCLICCITFQEPQNLDFEKILRSALGNHVSLLLYYYEQQLVMGSYRIMFAYPGEVQLITEGKLNISMGSFWYANL